MSALARGAYEEWRAVCVTGVCYVCVVCVCVCVGVVPWWMPRWHPSGALIHIWQNRKNGLWPCLGLDVPLLMSAAHHASPFVPTLTSHRPFPRRGRRPQRSGRRRRSRPYGARWRAAARLVRVWVRVRVRVRASEGSGLGLGLGLGSGLGLGQGTKGQG